MGEAVLTGTHNLCFGAKITKKDIPLRPCKAWFNCIKVGYEGVNLLRTCYPDVGVLTSHLNTLLSRLDI